MCGKANVLNKKNWLLPLIWGSVRYTCHVLLHPSHKNSGRQKMIFLLNRNLLLCRGEELAVHHLTSYQLLTLLPPINCSNTETQFINCSNTGTPTQFNKSTYSPSTLCAVRFLSVSHRGNKIKVLFLPIHSSRVDPFPSSAPVQVFVKFWGRKR